MSRIARLARVFRWHPGGAAQLVELRLCAFGGRILLDQIQPLQRNIEAIAALIEQNHAFLVVNERDAVVGSDAVIDVNDVVAGLEILKVGDKCRNFLPTAMLLRQMFGLVEDVGLGVDLETGIRQTAVRPKSCRRRRWARRVHRWICSGCSPNSERNGMPYS